jgi:glutaredoxin-related protein
MADLTYKKGDVGQTIVAQLWEKRVSQTLNTTSGIITPTATFQRVPLISGDTVKLNLKDWSNVPTVPVNIGNQTGGGTAVVTNLANSEVTYTLVTADLSSARTWLLEWEVTKTTGEIITVPDEPDPTNQRTLSYLTLEVILDLG